MTYILGSGGADGNDITRLEATGANITVGGSGTAPVVNVVSSPGFNKLTLSGASSFTTMSGTSLSAITISATTFVSGGTPLSTIINNLVAVGLDGNDITRIQGGTNVFTGGTTAAPTMNITGGTFISLSAGTLSGGTIYSGATNLSSTIIAVANSAAATAVAGVVDTNDITRIQPGTNTFTGGTTAAPTMNITGGTFISLSSTTLSGGNIYSGFTNLSSTIIAVANAAVAGGLGSTFTSLSGTSLNATNLTGGTIYSGTSELNQLIGRNPFNFSVTNQTINPSATAILAGSELYVGSRMRLGTTFKYNIALSKTASGTAALVFLFKLGATGGVGDATILTFTTSGGTGVSDTGEVSLIVTTRGPIGGSCIVQGQLQLNHSLQITGLATVPTVFANATSSVFNSSLVGLIGSVACTTPASTTLTFHQVTAEVLNI